jgi:hypothetical protein
LGAIEGILFANIMKTHQDVISKEVDTGASAAPTQSADKSDTAIPKEESAPPAAADESVLSVAS